MRYRTKSKVIISFNDLGTARSFIKAISAWFAISNGGGNAAILFADGSPGKGKEQRGKICGVVGHDVRKPETIEHIMLVDDATEEVNNMHQTNTK